jgi:hypothetical protein
MSRIVEIGATAWGGPLPHAQTESAVRDLEAGRVLWMPRLAFEVGPDERRFLTPAVVGRSKNVGYDPASGKLGGSTCEGAAADALAGLIGRFAASARALVEALFPRYRFRLEQARASFRPVEVAGRATSWRKDDTRLHVDSFPSAPTNGRRILRVFTNVNPENRPRVWRVGEPFETVARRFWPRLSAPAWGSRAVLRLLRVTRSYRSDYDHYMLQLHDRMKQDLVYQGLAGQERVALPAQTTWACFTDSVSHAAMSGQYQFEQTFHLDAEAMADPGKSPLRVLEGLAGRELVQRGTQRRAA